MTTPPQPPPKPTWTSHRLVVGGMATHVLEAGDPDAPTVVVVHYGGHGATVEEAWEYTIPALAEQFHVLAPEQLGYGKSARIYDFTDVLGTRVRHIANVLELFGVESAHFVGASTAGTMMLGVAAAERPAWPIDRVVGISAVGDRAGAPEVAAVLRSFDGTFETMDAVMGTTFPERWWDDAYVERRLAAARAPGAWQCTAAELLKPPWEPAGPSKLATDANVPYERIERPVLLVAGDADQLRTIDAFSDRAARIPNCRTRIFAGAGHYPHIQFADEFNGLALQFLTAPGEDVASAPGAHTTGVS